jgi:hypothetical protein
MNDFDLIKCNSWCVNPLGCTHCHDKNLIILDDFANFLYLTPVDKLIIEQIPERVPNIKILKRKYETIQPPVVNIIGKKVKRFKLGRKMCSHEKCYSKCKICNPSCVCEHGNIKYTCNKGCLCKHRRLKDKCDKCIKIRKDFLYKEDMLRSLIPCDQPIVANK